LRGADQRRQLTNVEKIPKIETSGSKIFVSLIIPRSAEQFSRAKGCTIASKGIIGASPWGLHMDLSFSATGCC
jgi:hypothetical protein